MALNAALLRLERAAADAAAALPAELTDDEVLALVAAWWPHFRGNRQSQMRQGRLWIGWIRDAGERWGSRDVEPSADELHQVLIDWCSRT